MNNLQLELTKLIGSKELSFGCLVKTFRGIGEFVSFGYPLGEANYYCCHMDGSLFEFPIGIIDKKIKNENIIGHPATLSDLQMWIISKFRYGFRQEHSDYLKHIIIRILDNSVVRMDNSHQKAIKYDSTKDLLDQPEETLKEIVAFIKANQ